MSITVIVAASQIVGAIAVVLTLLYVGVEIRQNSKAIRSSNATAVHINIQNLAQATMMDRELGKILLRSVKGEERLSPEEKLAAYGWFFQMLKTGELAYQSRQQGDLDEAYYEGAITFMRSFYQTPGFQKYWQDRKFAFSPNFRNQVEIWMSEKAPLTVADIYFSEDSI